jgi:hypothetical protein
VADLLGLAGVAWLVWTGPHPAWADAVTALAGATLLAALVLLLTMR